MRPAGHKIKKVEVEIDNVIISLTNGVTILVSSHKNNLHLHFCGTEVSMRIGCNLNVHPTEGLRVSNYFDVEYSVNKNIHDDLGAMS